ncbi:DUF3027 domain-containing protein [Nostocoides veronense]|uniref:DUF3027 domain-containing protein n=1 Tax=Nostocoides veronense TaxID=330836 RepID=A0ABP4XXL1_9MICO
MSAAVKADPALIGGVQLALDALAESAEPGSVGDHLGATMVAERLALHSFACTASAYPGWVWTVSLARAPRSKTVTVCETALLPGADALQAPAWLPYADRLAPGDVGPGDVTPYVEDDPLLVAGFEATGDEDVDATALWELGLGRARVLSSQGRAEAAQRWYDGDHGPGAAVAVKAPAPCASCGFFVPITGALRSVFGLCANEWSPSDGTVVSIDHGCGAHSEVDIDRRDAERVPEPIVDDFTVESVRL